MPPFLCRHHFLRQHRTTTAARGETGSVSHRGIADQQLVSISMYFQSSLTTPKQHNQTSNSLSATSSGAQGNKGCFIVGGGGEVASGVVGGGSWGFPTMRHNQSCDISSNHRHKGATLSANIAQQPRLVIYHYFLPLCHCENCCDAEEAHKTIT